VQVEGGDNLMTASMALTVKRLQAKWRSRMRAKRVQQRRAFMAQRRAAVCPSQHDLALHQADDIRAVQDFLRYPPAAPEWHALTGGKGAGADEIVFPCRGPGDRPSFPTAKSRWDVVGRNRRSFVRR
jgi:hypothetical protein